VVPFWAMSPSRLLFMFLSLTPTLIGCETIVEEFRQSTLAQSSFDLSCPEDQLTVTDLKTAVRVSGCGKNATYVRQAPGTFANRGGVEAPATTPPVPAAPAPSTPAASASTKPAAAPGKP
jgi:hypothetical protein